MKNLILAAVSAFALGIAGTGFAYAQTGTAPPATPPSSSATMHNQQTAEAPATHSKSQLMKAQRDLKADGLYNGAINGEMNSATRTALSKFQKKHSLQETGTLDQQTLAALSRTTNGSGSSHAQNTQPTNAGSSTSWHNHMTLRPNMTLHSNSTH